MADDVNVLMMTPTPLAGGLVDGLRAVSPRLRVEHRVVEKPANVDAGIWRDVDEIVAAYPLTEAEVAYLRACEAVLAAE